MSWFTTTRGLAYLVVASGIIGCSGGSSFNLAPTTVPGTAPLSAKKGQAVAVSPATLIFGSPTGASQTFTASENFGGDQTAVVSSPACASVSPASGDVTVDPTTGGTKSLIYTVAPIASGTCTITVTDKKGNTATVSVKVAPTLIAECQLPTANAFPAGIVQGSDGNMWTIEWNANQMARITPDCTVTEFPVAVPTGGDLDSGTVTEGPDGNVWFIGNSADGSASFAGRVTPSGVVTELSLVGPDIDVEGLTTGKDGNLWVSNDASGTLERVTPNGVMTPFPVPRTNISVLATDAVGNIWMLGHHCCTRQGDGNIVVERSLSGQWSFFPLPADGYDNKTRFLIAGADGNMWLPRNTINAVDRVTPTGIVTEFAIPTAAALPRGLVEAPDGNIWFNEVGSSKMARITHQGAITEYALPINSGGYGIAVGSDGNLWTTEPLANKIGIFKIR